jgi:hypothetical protein
MHHLRGDFLGINCSANNIFAYRNTIEQFSHIIKNQGKLAQFMIWGNIFAGGGGVTPNYLLRNSGSISGGVFAHNNIDGIDHLIVNEDKSSIANLNISNNAFAFSRTEQNWSDLNRTTNLTLASNLWNIEVPDQLARARNKTVPIEFNKHHLAKPELARNKGRPLNLGIKNDPQPGSAPDIGAFEDEKPIDLPTFEWLPLPGASETFFLKTTRTEESVIFELSQRLPKEAIPAGIGLDKDNRRQGDIACTKDRSGLQLICKLTGQDIQKIGFARKVLEEHRIRLWPPSFVATEIEDIPKREKLLKSGK